MKKSDELSNPNSCLNRAAADEPLFVLRANDELAADVVRYWVSRYFLAKGGSNKMTKKQLAKVDEATVLARHMEHWRSMNSPEPPSTDTAA